jgi:A/G-specific adenine glycosylase
MRPVPDPDPTTSADQAAALRASLLAWYDREGRTLPWRVRPEDRAAGRVADPYAVWLSEIMLQQTTVPHATPYWHRFLALWPTVHDLAAAPREQVMAEWAGLGYYARARNLHACAQKVSEELGGIFPDDLDGLRALPGVGEYTANAIRAAAFDRPASVVDGNVERVISRLFALQTPLPKSKPQIRRVAAALADPQRPGDYAQAIMDLGATVCAPRSPDCGGCPWGAGCEARLTGDPVKFPLKEKKRPKPVRRGAVFALLGPGHGPSCFRGGADHVLAVTRPDGGLLGGMRALPGTDWTEDGPDDADRASAQPADAQWEYRGAVRHVFTHFTLELDVWMAEAPGDSRPDEGEWLDVAALSKTMPTLYRKALALALA